MPVPSILTSETVNYSQNAKRIVKLDNGFVLREIALTLKASLTTTATAITAADLNSAGLWGLVKNLRLKIGSNNVIRDFSGDDLKLLQYFYYSQGDFAQESTLIQATTSTVAHESTLILPLWMVDAVQPIDTQLDARLLSNVELEITWGDVTDVTDVAGVTLEDGSMIETGFLGVDGPEGPYNTQVVTTDIATNLTANSKYQVDLPVGDLYRSLLIGCKDASGNDLAGVIDNIKLFSGGSNFVNISAKAWKAWQDRRDQTVTTLNSGADLWVSSNRNMDAWYYLDLVTQGKLSETINATGMSSLKLELELNSSVDELRVIRQQIIQVRPLAAPRTPA